MVRQSTNSSWLPILLPGSFTTPCCSVHPDSGPGHTSTPHHPPACSQGSGNAASAVRFQSHAMILLSSTGQTVSPVAVSARRVRSAWPRQAHHSRLHYGCTVVPAPVVMSFPPTFCGPQNPQQHTLHCAKPPQLPLMLDSWALGQGALQTAGLGFVRIPTGRRALVRWARMLHRRGRAAWEDRPVVFRRLPSDPSSHSLHQAP